MQVTPVTSNLISICECRHEHRVSFDSFHSNRAISISNSACSIPVEQLAFEVSQGSCVPGNAVLISCSHIQQWIQTLCTSCGLCLKHQFCCNTCLCVSNTYLCVSSPRKGIGKTLRQSCFQEAQQKVSHYSTSGVHTHSSSSHAASGIHVSSCPSQH